MRRKQTAKGKSKSTALKAPPPVTQKLSNTKLLLRLPPFSGAKAQELLRTTSISPRTPEIGPEDASSSLQPDEDIHVDSDTYFKMPEIPYDHDASPRQQIIDYNWESTNTGITNLNTQPEEYNEAASHPENAKDPGLPVLDAGASGKRKASESTVERSSSVNPGSHSNDNNSESDSSDLIIQPAVSKKARKRFREPIEVDELETDEEPELPSNVVTKGRQARKPSKKERARARASAVRNNNKDSDDASEEEGSYKNST